MMYDILTIYFLSSTISDDTHNHQTFKVLSLCEPFMCWFVFGKHKKVFIFQNFVVAEMA